MGAGEALQDDATRRRVFAVLKTLQKAPRERYLAQDARGDWGVYCDGRPWGEARVGDGVLKCMQVHDLIVSDGGRYFFITSAGRAWLRRALSLGDGFAAQHQERVRRTCRVLNGEPVTLEVNAAESPLRRLYARRGADGRRFLDDVEFRAGERLRLSATKAHMMPRITPGYDAAFASRRKRGGAFGGYENATHFVLRERRQFRRALEAVGPEMANVLLDICCFLKGLEQVEKERGWPARSAKVVLKLALRALARHYGYGAPAKAATGADPVRHWARGDYRPLFGPGSC